MSAFYSVVVDKQNDQNICYQNIEIPNYRVVILNYNLEGERLKIKQTDTQPF